MKKIFLLAVAALSFSTYSHAQIERKTDSTQKVQRKQSREQLYHELHLNEEQRKAMTAMEKEVRSRIKSIRQNPDLNPEVKREKYRELRDFRKAHLDKILTQEQQLKMKDWQKQRRKKAHNKKGERQNGKHMRQKNRPPTQS